jgi:hypothetical protein
LSSFDYDSYLIKAFGLVTLKLAALDQAFQYLCTQMTKSPEASPGALHRAQNWEG